MYSERCALPKGRYRGFEQEPQKMRNRSWARGLACRLPGIAAPRSYYGGGGGCFVFGRYPTGPLAGVPDRKLTILAAAVTLRKYKNPLGWKTIKTGPTT